MEQPDIETVLVFNEVGQKLPMKLITPLYSPTAYKQRELELLAVIEKQRKALAYVQPYFIPGVDCSNRSSQAGEALIEEALDSEPSQALREHEAKVRSECEKERIHLHQLLSAETTAKFEYKQRAEAAEDQLTAISNIMHYPTLSMQLSRRIAAQNAIRNKNETP